jgi:hypothetical protein
LEISCERELLNSDCVVVFNLFSKKNNESSASVIALLRALLFNVSMMKDNSLEAYKGDL